MPSQPHRSNKTVYSYTLTITQVVTVLAKILSMHLKDNYRIVKSVPDSCLIELFYLLIVILIRGYSVTGPIVTLFEPERSKTY